MSNDAGGSLRFGIDRLVVRGPRVFGWGWIADSRRSVRDVHLVYANAGAKCRLAASIGLARKDVAHAFPDLVSSKRSGFVVTGYVAEPLPQDFSLQVDFDDGSAATIDLGGLAEIRKPGRGRTSLLRRIARSFWRRLRTLDFSGLLRGPGGRRVGVRSIEDQKPREALARALRAARSVRVIFDHSMGGGANEYRRRAISRWLGEGETVLLLTYDFPTLEYRIHLFAPGAAEREFRAPGFLSLEAVLQGAHVAELFVNSPVSFDEPMVFADWIARLRRETPAIRLTVTVHDYFAVCPSFVLLNAEGRYCAIPDIGECERCLERHGGAHVAFSPPSRMQDWRRAWGDCLAIADEVRCFSAATRRLLVRAYPSLDRAATTIVPHAMDSTALAVPRLRHDAPLVIGVIGQISFQKGARIVTELLALLERSHPEIRLVVIGSLDVPSRSPRLEVTGPYRHEDLAGLIESHGVNMGFFPSIWPETFSYVVAEMMAMQLPVVAFDLGAPAERLRGYRLGRLCREVSAEAALETLIAFHRQLAVDEVAAA